MSYFNSSEICFQMTAFVSVIVCLYLHCLAISYCCYIFHGHLHFRYNSFIAWTPWSSMSNCHCYVFFSWRNYLRPEYFIAENLMQGIHSTCTVIVVLESLGQVI
jgi:hypothetical protein